MGAPVLRRLSPRDSLDALTEMLHRAYRPLAEMGLNYWATFQTPQDTAKRVGWGECFVLAVGTEVIGCIVLEPPSLRHPASWYRKPGVAVFHQFAVEPAWQHRGLGRMLLAAVEHRAREIGAHELALDTAEPATHLVTWYTRQGYRFVEHVQHEGATYRSVILSKAMAPARLDPDRRGDVG